MKYKYYIALVVFGLLITVAPPVLLVVFKAGLNEWTAVGLIGYIWWLFYGLKWIVFDIKVKYNE